MAGKQRNTETFKISFLGAGQMFGENDVIFERNYTTSIICRSNLGQVLCIKVGEFLRKLKANEECWKIIVN